MKALSNKIKLIQKTKIVSLCVYALFFISVAESHPRDWYVSHNGSGLKNGTTAENAWAGWNNIDWDTDGSGLDTGVGPGDTLYVIGTVRAIGFHIKGYGLSEKKRLTIKTYPKNPGKLWQGLEISGDGWKGPDTYGAYYKTVHFPTDYSKAVEWTKDPWTDAVPLETMQGQPDNTWRNKTGLYYCDSIFQKVYYKPTSGKTDGKTLTAWASTSKAIELVKKMYVTVSGLRINNPLMINNGADYAIIENCEISCIGKQNGIQVGAYPGYTPSHHGIIRNNFIHDCANGIYIINQGYGNQHNNDYWTVEYNYIANIHGTRDSHGIGVQGGTGSIFQFNHIFNAGSGITFWNAQQQIMRDNIVRFNKVNHMGYYGDGNGNGRGIEFSGETADSNLTTGNLIYGNIISDCNSDGQRDGVGIRSKMGMPSNGYSVRIFNNTVSDCGKSFYIKPTNYEGFEVGAFLHNNISVNPKVNGYHVFVMYLENSEDNQTAVKHDLSLDRNIYSGSGKFYEKVCRASSFNRRKPGQGMICNKEKIYHTLEDWQKTLKVDTKSLTANPRLNAALIPQQGGSGIDKGDDLSALTKVGLHPDSIFPTGVNNGKVILTEQSAHGSGWDIGAYIYKF